MASYQQFSAFYDVLTGSVNRQEMADFIVEKLNNYGVADGIVLDGGCGTGLLCIALAQSGYNMIGADSSADMLFVAQQNAAEAGQQVLFLNQFLTDLDLYGTVRACVSTMDTLSHLPPEDFAAALQKMSLFTEPGGLLIFDINTPYKHLEILGDNAFVFDEDDVFCVWRNSYDEGENCTDIKLTFFTPDEAGHFARFEEEFTEWAHTSGSVEKALQTAGYRVCGQYGGYDGSPLTQTSQRAVYICVKENN